MAGWKVYKTLDETLDFIGFGKGNKYDKHFKQLIANQPSYLYFNDVTLSEKIMPFLGNYLEKIAKVPFRTTGKIMHTALELYRNAYDHSTGKFFVEMYVGQKGALVGTMQEKEFFTKKQIEKLKNRQESNNNLCRADGLRLAHIEGKGRIQHNIRPMMDAKYKAKMMAPDLFEERQRRMADSMCVGTQIIMRNSDGILALPEKKVIYYSRLFAEEPSHSMDKPECIIGPWA